MTKSKVNWFLFYNFHTSFPEQSNDLFKLEINRSEKDDIIARSFRRRQGSLILYNLLVVTAYTMYA